MISRRAVILSTVMGAGGGLAGIAKTRSGAAIRFIGRRETIIALLDTGTERVIFLLGEQDDDLLADIAGLTTIGNSRIDLIVGSQRVLATGIAREHLNLNSTPALVIQADGSLPPIRGEVSTVTESADLQLGDGTSLRLTPSVAGGGHPDFVVDVICQETRLILTSGGGAMRMVNARSCGLLAVPGRPSESTISNVQSQLLVCNSPVLDEVNRRQMQVYPRDPQVVRIEHAGIHVRDDQLSS